MAPTRKSRGLFAFSGHFTNPHPHPTVESNMRSFNMNKRIWTRALAVSVCIVAFSGFAQPQIKELIKIVGVGAAVNQFAPDINRAFNRVASHTDTPEMTTKVVPIISVGINSRNAIGAAQVLGPRDQVRKVKAVAQLEADLFGREIRVRPLIPVESENVVNNVKRVPRVGVSGIVDLKL